MGLEHTEEKPLEINVRIIPPNDTKPKSLWIELLNNATVVAIMVGILTSLLAPYLIDRAKAAEANTQQRKEQAERKAKTQTEIVENLSRILFSYRTSANYLAYDYAEGQSDPKLLRKHIDSFDDSSIALNKEFRMEAFRARMYFNDQTVYSKLIDEWSRLVKIDTRISQLLQKQHYQITPRSISDTQTDSPFLRVGSPSALNSQEPKNENYEEWHKIMDDLQDFDSIDTVLNNLFQRIDKTD